MENKKLAIPYITWIIGFIIIPLFFIFYYGLIDNGTFTLSNVLAIFEKVHLKPLFLSIKLSLICVIVCLIIAIPLGVAIREVNSKIIVFLFVIPMWMNTILSIMAWKLLLSTNGIFNSLFHFGSILNTEAATLLGMIYDLLPFAIMPIYTAISAIDENVINSASDLGANKLQILFKIIIPNAKGGILSAIIMVFVPALTSFVVSDMLGGGKVSLIGNIIEQEFTNALNWNLGSGLSIVLMIFVFISTIVMRKGEKN